MDNEYIEVKGIKFEKCDDWFFKFPKGCLVTPIYKYNKIIRLLVTDKTKGNAFYVDSSTYELQFMNVNVFSMRLPQGISYLIQEACYLHVLTTWILIDEK